MFIAHHSILCGIAGDRISQNPSVFQYRYRASIVNSDQFLSAATAGGDHIGFDHTIGNHNPTGWPSSSFNRSQLWCQ